MLASFFMSVLVLLSCANALSLSTHISAEYFAYSGIVELDAAREIILQSYNGSGGKAFGSWEGAITASLRIDGISVMFIGNSIAIITGQDNLTAVVQLPMPPRAANTVVFDR